jgi:hypothetical protein
MKKYLLGLLLLLAFVQPLVVNMLVYNAQARTFHSFVVKSPVKKAPTSKNFGIDSIIVDLDDDDVAEANNKEYQTDLFSQSNLEEAYVRVHSKLATLKSTSAPLKHSSKPLYILWSVFRI